MKVVTPALTQRRERTIVGAFRTVGALSAPKALQLRRLGLADTVELRGLIAAAVVRRAGPERYFLSEQAWASRRRLSGRLTLLVLAALGAACLYGAIYFASH